LLPISEKLLELKMKSALLAAAMFALLIVPQLSVATEQVNANDQYVSAQGPIKLIKLENAISKLANAAKVEVTNVRWTRNPLAYAVYFLGKILPPGPFGSYVVDLKINESHIVTCDLILFLKPQTFVIRDCESATADVSGILGVGTFAELGLPQKAKL
jgi:hypothetical protein